MSHTTAGTPGWLESDSESEVEDEALSFPPPSPASTTGSGVVEEGKVEASSSAPPTPFPWASCLLICSINLINSASYLMTSPFVAFQIMAFFPGISTEEVGYYSGVLEASFHMGSIPGALVWSWVADRYGRRPALLYGLLGTALCTLVFGIAPNYACALLTRFMWGLLNGNVGVAKTVMSELATDAHMARAFSYLGLNAGLGRILGPTLGGVLSEPAKKWPARTPPLLVTFPYLLPCMVCALMALGTMAGAYVVLPETRGRSGAAASATPAALNPAPEDPPARGAPAAPESEADQLSGSDEEELQGLMSPPAAAAASAGRGAQAHATPSAAPPAAPAAAESELAGYLRLSRDGLVFGAVGTYFAIGTVGIITQEIYPLYLINGRDKGGFSMNTQDLGLLSMTAGFPILIFQLALFPAISKAIGPVRLQTWSLFVLALFIGSAPAVSLANNGSLPPSAALSILYVHYVLMSIARVSAFVANFVIVANAAPTNADRSRVCV
jgi:MFS family permease